MVTYIIRRLLLIIPTLLGIMLLNFIIIQVACKIIRIRIRNEC